MRRTSTPLVHGQNGHQMDIEGKRMMWIQMLWLAVGLLVLVLGAEALVRGASKMALSLGISPLVVGLTIVSIGTSAPEAAVSIGAALRGQADIAVGNVVGSNILNILLILGASAVITPLVVHIQLVRQEVPIMLAATVLFAVLAFDGRIAWYEGALLLALLVAYTVFLVVQSRRASVTASDADLPPVRPDAWDSKWPVQLALIAVGLALLALGAQWMVDAAVTLARALGVSDVIIGLTIVAVGTSMPEMATSLAAALKGERDIAVGNAVGSNIFNILGCVGAAGIASGGVGLVVAQPVLAFDLWVMLAVALACLPVFFTGREIARWEGALFLAYYVAYTAYLILAAQSHAALPAFSSVMLGFVAPLTVLALITSVLRSTTGNTQK